MDGLKDKIRDTLRRIHDLEGISGVIIQNAALRDKEVENMAKKHGSLNVKIEHYISKRVLDREIGKFLFIIEIEKTRIFQNLSDFSGMTSHIQELQ